MPPPGEPLGERGRHLLLEAWGCYDEYDHKAARLQARFRRLQMAILVTGIAAVLLVALQKQIELRAAYWNTKAAEAALGVHPNTEIRAHADLLHGLADGLHWVVLFVPLLLSGLIAAAHTFRPGDKWVLLRGAAEAVKRQIFRFRMRTGEYAGAAGAPTPEDVFFERVSAVNDRLKQTEVSKCALEQPTREGRLTLRKPQGGKEGAQPEVTDDGLTQLSAASYIALRLDDQLGFYSNRTRRFDGSITKATIWILIFGGIGTFLAALGLELWIPVATVTAAAITTYLRYTQSEETLVTYNRTRFDLKNVRAWWNKLTPSEQEQQENLNTLVDLTENALEGETTGWSQRMTDALSVLNRKENETDKPAGEQNKVK